MAQLTTRLARVEKDTRTNGQQTLEVWLPVLGRDDMYYCKLFPGEELTNEELEARPSPPNTTRIQVVCVDVPVPSFA